MKRGKPQLCDQAQQPGNHEGKIDTFLLFYRPFSRPTNHSPMSDFLFTSESVSEGHPDKVADAISDAVLDAVLAQDKHGRVAAETLVATGLVVMAGQITTNCNVNYSDLARDVIKRIG